MVDIDRAVEINRRLAEELGWGEHYDSIVGYLGFTFSPDERTFAEEVARWQEVNGLSVDGIIGEDTWEVLSRALGISGGMDGCWLVNVSDLIDGAVTVADQQANLWEAEGWVETTPQGRDQVEEYWNSVMANFPGVSTAWSAVFISWLFTRAYIHLAPSANVIEGVDLSDYANLPLTTRRPVMRQANLCLRDQSLFDTHYNHYRYVKNTCALPGSSAVVKDPVTTDIKVGDMVFAGRNGNTYQVVGDELQRDHQATSTPSSHIDIVVGIEELAAIPGVRMAVVVGGNTLPGANVVGRKYRPLVENGEKIAGVGMQPSAVRAAINNSTLSRVGSTSYYRFPGASAYERVQIANTEALFRLAP